MIATMVVVGQETEYQQRLIWHRIGAVALVLLCLIESGFACWFSPASPRPFPLDHLIETRSAVALLAPRGILQNILVSSNWFYLSLVLGIAAALYVALNLFFPPGKRFVAFGLPVVAVFNLLPQFLTLTVVAVFTFATLCNRRRNAAIFTFFVMLCNWLNVWAGSAEVGRKMTQFGLISLLVAFAAVLGAYVGTRRALLIELQNRVDEAVRKQAIYEEQARRAERTRIAREMHDIVAHKISLVALQAGGLEVNAGMPRHKIEETAGLIRTTATTALTELRQVLGVLRQDGDERPLVPQPTWKDVQTLVQASRDAGIKVELFDFVQDDVPDHLARTVHRIIQESLTNIHKHAPLSTARIALLGEPGGELIVEISNPMQMLQVRELPGAGMGITGLQERVAHLGGTLTTGTTIDGRFEVKAVIPWQK